MDDEGVQKPEPKISLVIGIFGVIACMVLDLISFLVPGAGDVEAVPSGIVFFLNLIFGVGGAALIVQGLVTIAKAIPLVQALPLWTPAWFYVWYSTNHPSKITEKINKVAVAEEVLEGGGAEGAGAAGEAAEAAGEAAEAAGEAAEAAEAAGEAAGEAAEAAGEAAGEAAASASGETAEGASQASANKENENTKPSETSTERDRTQKESGENPSLPDDSQGSEPDDESNPEDSDDEDEYNAMMETEAEKEPVKQLKEELFSENGPGRNVPEKDQLQTTQPQTGMRTSAGQHRLGERHKRRTGSIDA